MRIHHSWLLMAVGVVATAAATTLAADRPGPILGIPCTTSCNGGLIWNDPLTLCGNSGGISICCPTGSPMYRGFFGSAAVNGPYWAALCCPYPQLARWNKWKTALECYTPEPPCSPGGLEPCGGDL